PGCTVITATPVNGGTPTFSWYADGVLDASSTSSILSLCSPPLTTGMHQIDCYMNSSLQCANPFQVSSTINIFVLICTSTDEINSNSSWSIFPNPVHSICTLQTSQQSSVDAAATIFNPMGEKIMEQKISSKKTE